MCGFLCSLVPGLSIAFVAYRGAMDMLVQQTKAVQRLVHGIICEAKLTDTLHYDYIQ